MSKAIGMVEYKTVSAGITAADTMVKTSEIEVIQASTVCPGKYIVLVTGELSAVSFLSSFLIVLCLVIRMKIYSRQYMAAER